MNEYTEADVIAWLRNHIGIYGSQRALADAIGISPSYLAETLAGRRRPGALVLEFLRLQRRVLYVENVE